MPEKATEKNPIFSKPLPEILDDIQSATADAKKAAYEARTAGEKAAEEVMRRLRKLFLKMAKDITEALEEGK
jgi:predicted DsbA family dithiol-disulfide isomerase